ncbi:hypothetical protein D8674_022553 [Pyrus ussuriensis x Pyrus communis]|uniref:Uncharacterized protein n=1 Tax=Pyrus ussuriensis x Pyrus communis TaxID=2448454 RepID=A0A5N5GK89_9ROSA|nr:hypothetical protein D8674_022553 [Pyrus ussuriensis x Pyrus communis]
MKVFPKSFGMVRDSSTSHLPCQPTRPHPHLRFVDLPTPISIPLIPRLIFAAFGRRRALRSASNRIRYRPLSMCELFHVLPNKIAIRGLLYFAGLSDGSDVLEERLGYSDECYNEYGVLGKASCGCGCF